LVRPLQGPFSLRKGAALQELLQTYPTAQVFFNEGPVSDEPIWSPQLVQFAVVRHPLPRMLSQLLHTASLASEALFQDIVRVRARTHRLPAKGVRQCALLGPPTAGLQQGQPQPACSLSSCQSGPDLWPPGRLPK
jgi:hypothetical protein